MSFKTTVNEVIPNLYIGNYPILNSTEIEHFISYKFDAFINVAHELKYSPELQTKLDQHNIMVYKFMMMDNTNYNLKKVVEEVADLLKILLDSGLKVYVHCMMGISRSASAILLYLMKYKCMSYDQAFETLKLARPAVCPNPRFENDLRLYPWT